MYKVYKSKTRIKKVEIYQIHTVRAIFNYAKFEIA